MQFIADDSQDFVDLDISEAADNVRTNKNICRLQVNGLQQVYEVAYFLSKDSDFQISGLFYLENQPEVSVRYQ